MTTPRTRINSITKQRKPAFSFIECKRCGSNTSITDTFKDAVGQYWCPSHKNRGMLLNWAHEHKYPAIAFTGKNMASDTASMMYRIGFDGSDENKDLWKMNAALARDDVISAAMKHVGIVARNNKQEQEEMA